MSTNTIQKPIAVIDAVPTQSSVKWVLSAYRKQEDYPVDERPLPHVDTAILQKLFGQPLDNPMYDVYPVSEEQAKRLQPYAGHPLDLRKYDYFVECVGE
ncbi:MAG: cloacin immunity family protein [Armatimonadota bacterium]|nr:cloacin immunity family protein [Armatimonadota bacterium]